MHACQLEANTWFVLGVKTDAMNLALNLGAENPPQRDFFLMFSSIADVPTRMGILWPAKSGYLGHQPTWLTSDHAHLFCYNTHASLFPWTLFWIVTIRTNNNNDFEWKWKNSHLWPTTSLYFQIIFPFLSLTPVRRAKQSKTKTTHNCPIGERYYPSSDFLVIYLVMGDVIIASQPSSPLILCLHCQSLLSTWMAQPT